jgi:hypothetical protein
MIFVGHRDSLGFDHVLLPLLVLLVKDQAVTLGGQCAEEHSVQKGFELVAPAANSRPLIWLFVWVNGRFMKIDGTVGVAVRCRGLPDLFVQKNSGPTRDTGSEVGVHVVSSSPLLLQVLVAALEEVPVNLAENKAVALDARRLDGLQILLKRVEVHAVATGITLHVLSPQGIDA